MQANVYVEPAETYNQWLDQAATSQLDLANNQAVSEDNQKREKAIVIPDQTPILN